MFLMFLSFPETMSRQPLRSLSRKFKKSPKVDNQNKTTERDLYSLQNFIIHTKSYKSCELALIPSCHFKASFSSSWRVREDVK